MSEINPLAQVDPASMTSSSELTNQTNPEFQGTKTTQITTKDHSYITSLPTFQQRGSAIAKRLEEVKANPKYQKLSDEHKAKVRADLYDKYVPKSYSGFHLEVPNKETWVGATGRDQNVTGEKFSKSFTSKDTIPQAVQDFGLGAAKAFEGVTLFGTKITNNTMMRLHGLSEHFNTNNPQFVKDLDVKLYENSKRTLDNFESARKQDIQSMDFWLQTHPRNTTLGKLASDSGEFIATLPLYEAVGAIAGPAKGLTLSGKLSQSPVGKFVAKRLIQGSEFYMATLAESGGNSKTALKDAATGAVVAPVIEKAAKLVGSGIKIASAPLIKKWTANIIAMGGIPLAQTIAQSAFTEIEHGPRLFESDSINNITTHKSHELIHGISIHPAQGEEVGHFTTRSGDVFKYNDRNQRQVVFNALVKQAEESRVRNDAVTAKLHEAEKISLQSIAQQLYKKPIESLNKKQKLEVLSSRWAQITQAAQEAPVHLPELEHAEVQQKVQKEAATNPILADLDKKLALLGGNVSQAVTENNVERVAKETGISNVKAGQKKLIKATKQKGLGIGESESMSPNQYASHRVQSVAYFNNPRNRTKVAEGVSDRSKAGLNKFIDTLKESDQSKIRFENQTHRMLYHYGNRDSLPSGIRNSLLYRIRQVNGYENASTKDIQKESDWLHTHLLDLARSGHLSKEDNVFASSKFGGPFSWTKWQRELSSEAAERTVSAAKKALKQHPKALAGFDASIKALQSRIPTFQTPEEYMQYQHALSDANYNILKYLKTGDVEIGSK